MDLSKKSAFISLANLNEHKASAFKKTFLTFEQNIQLKLLLKIQTLGSSQVSLAKFTEI